MQVKKMALIIVFSIISAFLLPLCVFKIYGTANCERTNITQLKNSDTISVFMHDKNNVVTIPIEEYLCGVVCAEMPPEFDLEALKAQAVAARSYAMHKKEKTDAKHPDAAVCTDYKHCKAYKDYKNLDGFSESKQRAYKDKIENAVLQTKGEVLTYNGEIALAVFHSQSGGGKTENSEDVWGEAVPYLVSVESIGEENAPNFFSAKTVSFEEFSKIINKLRPDIKITNNDCIGKTELSAGGNVKNIIIADQSFTGREIREAFGLRSSCFKIEVISDKVNFEVMGYGHGVGMSQYGANAMAKEGKSYKEILKHYYSGTQIRYV